LDADAWGGARSRSPATEVKTIYFEKPNKVFIMDTNTGASSGLPKRKPQAVLERSVSGDYFFGGPVTVSSASAGCGVLTATARAALRIRLSQLRLSSTYSVARRRATQTIDINGFDGGPNIFY